MEGFTPSVLMMIILAVIIGFAVECFFMKQREKLRLYKLKYIISKKKGQYIQDSCYVSRLKLIFSA